jgi:hypothetical protein
MTGRCPRATLAHMLNPCHECGHAIWSEVRRTGSFRFVVFFDDDERSDTYAEPARSCPRCGVGLTSCAQELYARSSRPRWHVSGDRATRFR